MYLHDKKCYFKIDRSLFKYYEYLKILISLNILKFRYEIRNAKCLRFLKLILFFMNIYLLSSIMMLHKKYYFSIVNNF